MYDKQTLHSLNKSDPLALVYFDAYGNIIRLTESDFSSKKEFRNWKNWMNMKCHSEEKREHKYKNRFVPISFSDETLAEYGIPDHETFLIEAEEREEREVIKAQMSVGFFTCLSDSQQARMWLYAIEGWTTREIAESEGVAQPAIIHSLTKARKNILTFLQKGGYQTPDFSAYSEGVIN